MIEQEGIKTEPMRQAEFDQLIDTIQNVSETVAIQHYMDRRFIQDVTNAKIIVKAEHQRLVSFLEERETRLAQKDKIIVEMATKLCESDDELRQMRIDHVKALKIISVYEDHMDTYQARCANEELKTILAEDA